MAKVSTKTVTTTTVTLELTEEEATNLRVLLGFHIAGQGKSFSSLVSIWREMTTLDLDTIPFNVGNVKPLFITDNKE